MLKNHKIIFLCLSGFFAIYILYGLYRTYQEQSIVRIDYVGTNPTEFIFPVPVDSVRNCILSIKQERHFKGLTIMEYDNRDSLVLRDVVSKGKYSYVYKYDCAYKRRTSPSPPQHYELKVDLIPISTEETKVIVKNIHHHIISGVKFWLNLTFNERYIAKTREVESTTIEEYELLRYIGKLLGYIDTMPYVEYPSSLSKHEVLLMFGGNNPFSLEEMFYGETDTMPIGDFYSYGQKYGLKKDIANKIRKSLKYVKEKDRREFIEDLKCVFRAQDMETAGLEFDMFGKKWCRLYPKALMEFDDPYIIEMFCRYSRYSLPIRRVIYGSNSQMKEDSLTTGIPFLDTYQ